MTIQFLIVYFFLIVQISIFLILQIPNSRFRQFILRISQTNAVKSFESSQKWILLLCFLFFVESIRQSTQIKQELKENGTLFSDDDLRADMFYNQRNIYLTGFALFVSYALNRFIHLQKKYYNLKKLLSDIEKENQKDKKNK